MVVLQQAAVIQRLCLASPAQISQWFPTGLPHIPYHRSDCDNQVSTNWDRTLTSRGTTGQQLITVSSELSRTSTLRSDSQYLEGDVNVVADDISRNNFSLPFPLRCSQLFAKHPFLGSWDFFLPSPALLQLLYSKLFSGPVEAPCALPKDLGQFVPVASITSSSPMI